MFDDIDPLTCTPTVLLSWLSTMEPGLLSMSLLASLDPSVLSPEDAISFIQVHERISSWWASVQLPAVVAAASPKPLVDEYTLYVPEDELERTIRIEDAIRDEYAAAVRVSPLVAQHVIEDARLLTSELAETGEALARGEITRSHVRVVVQAAQDLPGRWALGGPDRGRFTHACIELQRRVLPTARHTTPTRTRAAARRAVLEIDAEGHLRRREQARCTRDVWVAGEGNGLSLLTARMATEQASALLTQINGTVHSGTHEFDPASTVGERRVETLAALVLGSDGATTAPMRAHVDVVVTLDTLLGLARAVNSVDAAGSADGIAMIRGADGPASAEAVRDLLADPAVAITLRRLVTDPVDGHLLDYGRRSYPIPQRLRDYLVARDRTCRFPGCNRRADLSQLDHAVAWDDGGETTPQNLGALCVRHHQLKTFGGWQIIESRSDGSCRWRSPHGRIYDHDPPPF